MAQFPFVKVANATKHFDGYLAFGKLTPFSVSDVVHIVAQEPGDLWFAFGRTEDEALNELGKDLDTWLKNRE